MEYFPSSFFIQNRYKLQELLLPSSVVILSANKPMPRNGDQDYPYRQSSDLFYLSGIIQEGITLVIYPGDKVAEYKHVLFIPKGDQKTEKWNGPFLSKTEASNICGLTDIRYTDSQRDDIRDILTHCTHIYFGTQDRGSMMNIRPNEFEIRQSLAESLAPLQEHQLAPLMSRIRMFKEPEEIAMIKKAIGLTGIAFQRVLKELKPGISEAKLAALISYEFSIGGASGHAFEPILASGRNALILHYIKNAGICKKQDLLLMDFGAEWSYYAADISRTLPVSGRFDKRQRDLYESCLRILKEAMKLMIPGKSLSDYNKQVGGLWEEEHIRLGLYTMKDVKNNKLDTPLWKKYFWHSTSHSIGIDVHDTFDHSLPLGEGMVLSCEPGIYIPDEGIGIRLENEMLLSASGAINLSKEIPIEVEEIEMRMNAG